MKDKPKLMKPRQMKPWLGWALVRPGGRMDRYVYLSRRSARESQRESRMGERVERVEVRPCLSK